MLIWARRGGVTDNLGYFSGFAGGKAVLIPADEKPASAFAFEQLLHYRHGGLCHKATSLLSGRHTSIRLEDDPQRTFVLGEFDFEAEMSQYETQRGPGAIIGNRRDGLARPQPLGSHGRAISVARKTFRN